MPLGGEHDRSRAPRGGVGDWIYQRLREGIVLGDFTPGERLRQSEVAEHFDVSQTPVREALARLASDGLVTLQPRRGAVVSTLSRREIDEVYELREVLDPYVVTRTVERATEEDLDAIRLAAEKGAEPAASSTELFERNRLFHLELYKPCGNRRMVQLFESLWDSVTAMRMFDIYASDPGELAEMDREHRAIADAMCARDAELASQLVHEHATSARRELLELLAREEMAMSADGG